MQYDFIIEEGLTLLQTMELLKNKVNGLQKAWRPHGGPCFICLRYERPRHYMGIQAIVREETAHVTT